MKRPRRRIATAAAAAVALLALAPIAPASASHQTPLHWDRVTPEITTAEAQIYFEDSSSSLWPVTAAVPVWDKASRVAAYYRSWGNCNRNRVHCVRIYSADYGNIGWYGITKFKYSADNHFVHGSMYIDLNEYRALTADQRRSVTCHELGHAMGGMNDNSRQDASCMYGTDALFPLYPTQHDYDILSALYNH